MVDMFFRGHFTSFVFLFAVIAASVSSFSQTVRADLILGNYDVSTDWNAVALYNTSNAAVGFQMGADSYSLDSLMLRLNYAGNTPIVQLRNDNGASHPGSIVLANFITPASYGSIIADYSFVPTTATTLDANEKYWLVVSGAGSDFGHAAFWYRLHSNLDPAGSAASFIDYNLTTDGGGTWGGTGVRPTFELQGTQVTAVPEPTSLTLVAVGALAGGWRRLRRR